MTTKTIDLHFKQENLIEPGFISKKWGTELIISREPHACKIMTLYPNQQVSLHWHAIKTETFVLIKGELVVELINQKGERNIITLTTPCSSITIDKNTPHTFYCPDGQENETIFIEASTEDSPDDSYRIYPSGSKGEGICNWGSTD